MGDRISLHQIANTPRRADADQHRPDACGEEPGRFSEREAGPRDGGEKKRRKKHVENKPFGLFPEIFGIFELQPKQQSQQNDRKIRCDERNAVHDVRQLNKGVILYSHYGGKAVPCGDTRVFEKEYHSGRNRFWKSIIRNPTAAYAQPHNESAFLP